MRPTLLGRTLMVPVMLLGHILMVPVLLLGRILMVQVMLLGLMESMGRILTLPVMGLMLPMEFIHTLSPSVAPQSPQQSQLPLMYKTRFNKSLFLFL
jgi:hypothetical protein